MEPLNLPTGRIAAADRLRQLIESNHFEAGDRLPSEPDLAKQLGVSRATVREAKSTLEAMGLLEIRRGSGSYITDKLPQQRLSSIWSMWYATHRDELIHLLQVREALELKAALLATANMDPELIDRLKELNEQMETAGDRGDVHTVAYLDAQFHNRIAAASGNMILVQLLSSLDAVLREDRIAVYSLRERLDRSLRDHARIVAALEKEDPAVVTTALAKHFESVLQDVQAVAQTLDAAE